MVSSFYSLQINMPSNHLRPVYVATIYTLIFNKMYAAYTEHTSHYKNLVRITKTKPMFIVTMQHVYEHHA